jgi:ketol-acid reductoisomerase
MLVKVYLDEDADLLDLQKKVCAVIGFGSQGDAHGLNLRNSGIPTT